MERKLKNIIKEGILALGIATAIGVGTGTFLVKGSKSYVEQIRREVPYHPLIEDTQSIDELERSNVIYKQIKNELYKFDRRTNKTTPLVSDYGW